MRSPLAWRDVVDFLLPRRCAACASAMDAAPGVVCGACWAALPVLASPQCERCGHPRGRDPSACPGCALLPPFVRNARSLCWVPDPVASPILEALKYHDWPEVAAEMGVRLARLRFAPDVERERALVVPIPLHPDKERTRGYNQAAALATVIAARWGISMAPDVVRRGRATRTQARLTPGARAANVQGAFAVPVGSAARVRGRHLVLVDDVLTTGATLNSCAAALFHAGARTLSYLTFGRARPVSGR